MKRQLSNLVLFRSISDGSSDTESREVSLNENVYDSSVDFYSIDKSNISNINIS